MRSLAALRCFSCAQSPGILSLRVDGLEWLRSRGNLTTTRGSVSLHLSTFPSTYRDTRLAIAMSTPEQVAQNHSFAGTLTKYKGTAHSLGGLETQFNVFLPEQALNGEKVP